MKSRSRVLIIAGLVLLLAAGALVLYNRLEDRRAGEESELVLTQLEEATSHSQLQSLDARMPMTSIGGRSYVGTIRMDSVGIELPVLASWDEADAKIAPCRYSGSAYNNSLVICGHNYQTHFGPISNLQEGDEVVFTDVNGNEFFYEVTEFYTLQPEDVAEMITGADWDLTLFTCTLGGRSRVTVRCVQTDRSI